MQQYSCSLINGYPIANIRGRNFLVDTGLPFTVADRPMLIEGKRFEVAPEVMGITARQMSSSIGFPVDGILGANVTDEFVLTIKPLQHQLGFDQYLDAFPVKMEIENLGGTAIMKQTIAGKRIKAFLNLGTRLSYISPAMIEGLEPIGLQSDVLGMVGEIETEVYELPISIGRDTHSFHFGVIPTSIQHMADMANVQASIGCELLQHYALALSMDEGMLMLDPLRPKFISLPALPR
ncbi:MAG: hypothetical protein ABJL54_18800 [Halioglobus sp.]